MHARIVVYVVHGCWNFPGYFSVIVGEILLTCAAWSMVCWMAKKAGIMVGMVKEKLNGEEGC
jgi:hypothetical protein